MQTTKNMAQKYKKSNLTGNRTLIFFIFLATL